MKKQFAAQASVAFIVPSLILGCGSPTQEPQADTPQTETPQAAATNEQGTLQVYANGEERLQEGFTSKDGWDLTFDHVYVNFGNVTAYQTEPPYEPGTTGEIQASVEQPVVNAETVDLVTGNETNPTVLVGETQNVPPGHYNALSWEIVQAADGPAQGYSMVMIGTAEQDGETIDFVLNVDQPFTYQCGEFVGDQRKGIVQGNNTADLEATFHFDHLFGEASRPAGDALNQGALGFGPIAAVLAQDGTTELNVSDLEAILPPDEYQQLQTVLAEVGHVGEGHCYEVESGTVSS